MRKIIHIDLDAFYPAAETLDNPLLAGKPLIVGRPPEERGVVASASYEARKFGVRSAMSTYKALKLCPHAILVPPRFWRYRELSDQMHAILHRYTDLIEPLSLDECYLDVTENKMGLASATEIARRIKNDIKAELGLTASAGVSSLKFVAKIASDMQKPDGLVVISPRELPHFLANLPVEKIWGVGKITAQRLSEMGISTAAQLAVADSHQLATRIGKLGLLIQQFAQGKDDRPVEIPQKPKQTSRETTFAKDLNNLAALKSELRTLALKVAQDLVQQEENSAKTLTVKIKYSDFSVTTRSRSFSRPLADADTLVFWAQQVLEHAYDSKRAVRLLGLGLSHFESSPPAESRSLLWPENWQSPGPE